MAIELNLQTTPAVAPRSCYSGAGSFVVAGGKSLKIESSPDGDEYLYFELPEGNWNVAISINIISV